MCLQKDLFCSLVYHYHFGEEIFQDLREFILSDSQELPYQHDDSETLEDIVIFSATDGFNTADGVLRVQHGVMLLGRGSVSLFTSMTGHLVLTCEEQAGLMLLYMHNDTESLEDSFTVQLTDGKRTVQGTLYIYIMPVNDEIPHLSRNIGLEVEAAEKTISSAGSETDTKDAPGNELGQTVAMCPGDIVLLAKPVTLTEGDRVTLTTDVPVATDGTSKPEKLLYAVSLPPVHGQIEHINYPGVPISSYSQLDVVAQKDSDVHDNSHGAGKESLSGHKRHTTELAGFFNLLNGGSGGGVVGDFIFQMVRFPEDMANSIEESLL
ncbi:LOW QUALITY PROTEIN: FRAS1-related extracellular matrix protein 1-like [Leptosomus discolor]